MKRTTTNNLLMQWKTVFVLLCSIALSSAASAQGDATATARMDARQIAVGDQMRLFIEVRHNPSVDRVEWAAIPDTFNTLEVLEKGKIDTQKAGGYVTYKQRLILTGFDSGVFKVPPFVFPVIPVSGTAYTVQTDSFQVLVQTVAVDTTKAFKPIKGIMAVEGSWLDNIGYIIVGILLLGAIIGVVLHFIKRKKPLPLAPIARQETLQERTLRQLDELEIRQLWQKNQVKEYYVELTDIVRNYIEGRFHTPALELTTDELLSKAQLHKELMPHHGLLAMILTTADLAKFAKAQPSPQEHIDAMEKAKQLVLNSKPIVVMTPPPTEQTI